MKNIIQIVLCSGMVFFLSFGIAGAADSPDTDYRKAISQVKLPVPVDPQTREYLGIAQNSGQFNLSQISSDIIIIEIFSMYCPYCQLHAPMTNKFFQTIQGRSDLKGRVKFIGIGIGNSSYEVGIFRKKYKILFPLFDDKNSSVLNALPGIRTPHYFALKKGGASSVEMFFSQQGPYNDDQVFLDKILKKSGLKF